MNRTLFVALAVAAAVVGAAGAAHAQDASGGVSATLTIAPSTTLSLQARNVSNDAAVETVTFGPVSGSHTLANQYVDMGFASNYPNWKVLTFTANRATTDTTSQSWGALVGASDSANRIGIMWRCLDATTPGGPTFNATEQDTFTYYKDTGDSDYAGSVSGGYTTVMYGSGVSFSNNNRGEPVSTPVAFYVGALTGGVLVPDQYSTVLRFELIHL